MNKGKVKYYCYLNIFCKFLKIVKKLISKIILIILNLFKYLNFDKILLNRKIYIKYGRK